MDAAEGRWDTRAGDVVVCMATAANGLGLNAHQTWAWRRAEIAAIIPSPFRDAAGDSVSTVPMCTLPPSLFGADRIAALSARAFEDIARTLERSARGASLAVSLCVPSNARRRAAAAMTREVLRARLDPSGIRVTWNEHTLDHASFAAALAEVLPQVERGSIDLAVVGGADSYHDPDTIEGLLAAQRVVHGAHTEGMIPGEGAAFVLVARAATARQFGLTPQAWLEAASWRSDAGAAGSGMSSVLRDVFEAVRARREAVDWWLHDLTGEPFRAREIQLWLPRASAGVASANARMEALPPLLGDLGAATMPTATAIAVEGFTRAAVDAARCVIVGSSPEGARGAVLLARGR